jgi:uncharacterized protein YndB with AHSA1/START domain
MMEQRKRAFEMTIEIAVPPEAVWHALTDAQELVRWFPLNADITPGQGGKWFVSWDGNWPWTTGIEIWEPNRHLGLVDRQGRPYDAEGKRMIDSVAPMEIAIDWHLDAKGGSTIVRLVHSGFGRGGAWDDEYEGVSLGWQMELRCLRHYLEHHLGHDRRVTWQRSVIPAPVAAVWSRLFAADGLVRNLQPTVRAGDRFATTLSTGDRLEGTVLTVTPNRGFQMTVDRLNNGIYRLWIDRVEEKTAVNSWLTTYDVPDGAVQAFGARVEAELDRIASVVAA